MNRIKSNIFFLKENEDAMNINSGDTDIKNVVFFVKKYKVLYILYPSIHIGELIFCIKSPRLSYVQYINNLIRLSLFFHIQYANKIQQKGIHYN